MVDTGYLKVYKALDKYTREIRDNGDFRREDFETTAALLGCVVGELSRIADAMERLISRMEDPKDPATRDCGL